MKTRPEPAVPPRLGRTGKLAAALALACTPALAATEEDDLTRLSLEQLMNVPVYSASKYAQSANETPSSVTVVTAEDIRTFGWRTLADVLRSTRGFYIQSDRVYDYVGARGFSRSGDYNSRLLVLIDGNRINDSIYDSGMVGTEFPLDLALVERIEIVRGPSASVYGSNALFGVVSVFMREGKSLPGWRLEANGGSFGNTGASASWGGEVGGGTLLAGASTSDIRGPSLDFPETAGTGVPLGRESGTDRDRHASAFAKYVNGGLSADAYYGKRDKGQPGGQFGTVSTDTRNRVVETNAFVNVSYRRDWTPALQGSVRFFAGQYDYDGTYVYPEGVINKDAAFGRWWGTEARVLWRADAHTLSAGAEYQSNVNLEQDNYNFGSEADPLLRDRRHGWRLGFYAQDDWRVSEAWLLSIGGRGDRYSGEKAAWSPRLGAVWKPVSDTILKMQYGSAFRAPNAFEKYASFPEGPYGNPQLGSERMRTVEATLEHFLSARSRVLASVYRYTLRGIVDLAERDSVLVFENTGSVRAEGAELELEHRWRNGARLLASVGLQRARDDEGATLAGSPRRLGKLLASLPVAGTGAEIGLEAQASSRRLSHTGYAAGYAVANAVLNWRGLAPNLDLQLQVRNLLDRRYADPIGLDVGVPDRIGFVQDGRTFFARASLRF